MGIASAFSPKGQFVYEWISVIYGCYVLVGPFFQHYNNMQANYFLIILPFYLQLSIFVEAPAAATILQLSLISDLSFLRQQLSSIFHMAGFSLVERVQRKHQLVPHEAFFVQFSVTQSWANNYMKWFSKILKWYW